MEAPRKDVRRRKGWVVVVGLFGSIAATLGGFVLLRSAFGPAKACDYQESGGRPCGDNTICAMHVANQARCLPFASQSNAMTAPFRADVRFACTQGPLAPKGRSHSFATDAYAVDLMPAPDAAEAVVVAPLDGEVHVYDRCEERDASPNAHNDSPCGAGYGNHVRIWDDTDLVLLGHLARVTVKEGARVKRGDPIGIAGASGQAGSRHVHVVVTRLRPGDHIGTILSSVGNKGGVVTKGLMRARKADGGTDGAVSFDALDCAETPKTWWTAAPSP
jgi:hypothetical protein